MATTIKAINIELTSALRDYAERRFESIAKYAGGEAAVSVEIGKTSNHHHQSNTLFVAQVHVLTMLGKQYHASSEKADLYEAIDDVRAEIVSALTSGKGKKETLFRRGANKIKKLLHGER